MTLAIGSLFAGYGGLDLAVSHVLDAAPSRILAHHWPDVPNRRDVTTVDWPSVPQVDIITGGSPCQDLSLAGARRGMTNGTRSNLWVSMREAIATIRPLVTIRTLGRVRLHPHITIRPHERKPTPKGTTMTNIDRLDDLLSQIGTESGGSYAELIDVAADVVSESRRETPAPQIVRTVEELEALDPEMVLWDSVGDLFQAGDYLHAEDTEGSLAVYTSDFPAVVVAPAAQVRAARKALEEA